MFIVFSLCLIVALVLVPVPELVIGITVIPLLMPMNTIVGFSVPDAMAALELGSATIPLPAMAIVQIVVTMEVVPVEVAAAEEDM